MRKRSKPSETKLHQTKLRQLATPGGDCAVTMLILMLDSKIFQGASQQGVRIAFIVGGH